MDKRLKLFQVLLVLLLAGCSSGTASTATVEPTSTPILYPVDGPNSLMNTYWNLILMDGQPVVSGSSIVLRFSDRNINGGLQDSIYGYAGCNWYRGPYHANSQQIRAEEFQITARGCMGVPGVMTEEETYTNLFDNILVFKIAEYRITTDGDQTRLEILDDSGQPVLVYESITQYRYETLYNEPPSVEGTRTLQPTVEATATVQASHYGDSFSPSISADGRYIVFASRSDHLVQEALPQCIYGGESYACSQIYLYDRTSGEISLVSRTTGGNPGSTNSDSPQISADGQWIVFASEIEVVSTTNQQGVFLKKIDSNQIIFVGEGLHPRISGDGSAIVYFNTKPGENFFDVYLYDRQKDQLTNLSRSLEGGVTTGDSLWPAISSDGNWVAFWSWSGYLNANPPETCSLSRGNQACGDVYILNRVNGNLTRIEAGVGSGEGQFMLPISLSDDGRWVSFNSTVYDRSSGQEVMQYCESNMNNWTPDTICFRGTISGDGRWVVFAKSAAVYVQGLGSDKPELVSVAADGTPGNGQPVVSAFCDTVPTCAQYPYFDISVAGRFVVFSSTATNLGGGDAGLCNDLGTADHPCMQIYIRDMEKGTTARVP